MDGLQFAFYAAYHAIVPMMFIHLSVRLVTLLKLLPIIFLLNSWDIHLLRIIIVSGICKNL